MEEILYFMKDRQGGKMPRTRYRPRTQSLSPVPPTSPHILKLLPVLKAMPPSGGGSVQRMSCGLLSTQSIAAPAHLEGKQHAIKGIHRFSFRIIEVCQSEGVPTLA